jgi:hypothetical protein
MADIPHSSLIFFVINFPSFKTNPNIRAITQHLGKEEGREQIPGYQKRYQKLVGRGGKCGKGRSWQNMRDKMPLHLQGEAGGMSDCR